MLKALLLILAGGYILSKTGIIGPKTIGNEPSQVPPGQNLASGMLRGAAPLRTSAVIAPGQLAQSQPSWWFEDQVNYKYAASPNPDLSGIPGNNFGTPIGRYNGGIDPEIQRMLTL